ncbi:uncharacterized protein LOC132740895 isoform X2 [Ruditapes philippinarum]|uniref:uncharacterized protein LOC132740895 isoform X2 n=1 Tax=Ruditapes philippinarum TaxID=129788 RepID=UPI00295C2A4E|nr:uncharacterized protein LOC132740895 isoform X2 [Ruditapes philippinarum]
MVYIKQYRCINFIGLGYKIIKIIKMRTFLRLTNTKHFVRAFKTAVNVHDLKFREASNDDKSTILSLRHNVYRGLDYLPDQFDYFLHDDNRRCIVGELDGTLVSFGVILFLDGGESILGQAGRVHETYEGQGLFGAMNQYFNKIAIEHGCKRRVALVETSFNKYTRSEKFKLSHVEIASKLHYVGVVTEEIRLKLEEPLFQEHDHSEIIYIAPRDMHIVFNSTQI